MTRLFYSILLIFGLVVLVRSLSKKEAFVDGPEYETTLTDNEIKNAQVIAEEPKKDPTTEGNRFEGDIILTKPLDVGGAAPDGAFRNAAKNEWDLWTNKKIPYKISSIYSSGSRSRIAAAMKEYASKTCLEFVPRTSERDYIYITADDGCYSEVGRSGGRQIVSLDAGCLSHGVIIHEFMHVAGFYHEQSRADRDDWIEIDYDNIQRGASGQFRKYSLSQIDHLGTQYDYGSVMHYGPYAFSRNGLPTITQKRSGARMGQRSGFSSNDITKINRLYNCDGTGTGGGGNSFTRAPPTGGGGSSRSCVDGRDDCSDMKTSCRFSITVRRLCPKTCGTCNGGGGNGGGGGSSTSCTGDKKANCSIFASNGYCNRSYLKNFMQRNCCESCKNS